MLLIRLCAFHAVGNALLGLKIYWNTLRGGSISFELHEHQLDLIDLIGESRVRNNRIEKEEKRKREAEEMVEEEEDRLHSGTVFDNIRQCVYQANV